MVDFHQSRQQPEECYSQFAVALQAILAEATGDRFSSEDQEYLVSTCFIVRVNPPALLAHLKSLERMDIAELVKTANTFTSILGNRDYPQTSSRSWRYNQPRATPSPPPPPRNPRPARAIQSKSESVSTF
ncbi:unnamed protein product [Hymenolepis diminuta]|uniref:Uncharacterized protein n=1 Tax=Hymenolepis diminuta TaxID=6216 RepID=A0A564XWU6_HYMDI|nr:unnamed protein product [Hymenolepis diminuta]